MAVNLGRILTPYTTQVPAYKPQGLRQFAGPRAHKYRQASCGAAQIVHSLQGVPPLEAVAMPVVH